MAESSEAESAVVEDELVGDIECLVEESDAHRVRGEDEAWGQVDVRIRWVVLQSR